MATVLPTTFTYVDDAGATVEATKSWVLNWDKVASASWFAVPKIMPVKWVFDARAIVPICIMFIVTAVETVGDIPVSQRAVLEEKLQTKNFLAALCAMVLDLHWQQYLAYFRILLSART